MTAGYAGSIVGPLLVGFIADLATLRIAFLVPVVATRGVGVGRGSDPRPMRRSAQAIVPSTLTSDPSGAGATMFPSTCRPSTSSDVIRPVMPTGLPIAIR